MESLTLTDETVGSLGGLWRHAMMSVCELDLKRIIRRLREFAGDRGISLDAKVTRGSDSFTFTAFIAGADDREIIAFGEHGFLLVTAGDEESLLDKTKTAFEILMIGNAT